MKFKLLAIAMVVGVITALPVQSVLAATSQSLFKPAATKPAVLPHVTPATVNNNPNQLPVLWVHGLINMLGGCAGIRADIQASTLKTQLTNQGYTGPFLGVAYYCGDSGSFTIRDCAGTYGQTYGNDVPIERLGLDLAWCIYNSYSAAGQYINIAGHSMGGLMIDEALTKAGTPGYPPYLLVQNVLTYSTPYNGTDRAANTASWCGTYVQCKELAPGSDFVKALQLRTLPTSVDWTTVGGGPADNVDSFASSSAVSAQHKVNYYSKTPTNYNHNTYFSDASTAHDEPFNITNNGVTTSLVGSHATYMGATALVSLDL